METASGYREAEPARGYREVAPGRGLAGVVECYWFRSGRLEHGVANRILPDGCMDIIVNLGDPIRGSDGADGAPAFVVGIMSVARVVRLRGAVDTIGIRFRPGAAPAALDVPADELTDLNLDLAELWGRAATRDLVDRLVGDGAGGAASEDRADEGPWHERADLADDASSRDRRRARVLDALLRRRTGAGQLEDDAVTAAVRAIRRTRGAASIADVARDAALSVRQLERRFAERVGLPPKQIARIERFRLAARLLREHPDRTGSRIALDAGYYDQSHMTREFNALAGLSPTAYLAERVASVQDT